MTKQTDNSDGLKIIQMSVHFKLVYVQYEKLFLENEL